MSETHDIKSLAIIPRTIVELVSLAELLAKSELLPKALRGKVPDVAMTIMAGQEMGFTPMASLRNFHVIEGKPVLSASGKVALVRASGKCKYFDCVEDGDDRVTYETMRIDSTKPQRATWTKDRVKNAGLNTKDNYRLFQRQMLHARAKSELCENTYEDVLGGTATAEEIGDWIRQPGHVDAIDAEFVDVPVDTTPEVEPPELAQIDTFETEAELKAFSVTLNEKLPPRWKDAGRQRYGARLAMLRAKPTEKSA